MYKIVFMDMDGTILKSDGTLSSFTKETMKVLNDNNIKLVLCTGRMHQNARHFARLLELNCPIISSNGSIIKEIYGEEFIFKNPIPKNKLIMLQNELDKLNLRSNYYTVDTLYVGIMRKYVKTYEELNKILSLNDQIHIKYFIEEGSKVQNEAVLSDFENINKAMFFPSEDVKDEVITQLKEKLDLNVVSSGKDNIEVTDKKSDKAYAIHYLCDYYNIDVKDSICFGDSLNDLKMLQTEGLTVAMDNSSYYIKSIAKDTCLSNDSDGVAKYLREVFKDYFN